MIRKTEGFTLLELIISIAVGTMITIAATTTLLLGLRINAGSTENVKQQNTTSMLVQVLENIAAKEDIEVKAPADDAATPVWYIKSTEQDDTNAYLKVESNKIYLNGNVFMEDVTDFDATIDTNNQRLTVTITTDGKDYTASIYCRLNPTPTPTATPEDNT